MSEPFAETSRRLARILALLLLLSACSHDAPSVTEQAALTAGSFDASSLSFKTIPPSDLPPEGTRSLFDHIIKENGALPYPFEELVKVVASYDRDGRMPPALLIPDGRSLLKAHAHFGKPRVIVAADARQPETTGEVTPYLRGRLFLGFVEDANEIEIISYNEQAGRFEFQLVKDYRKGGSPRLVYAKRAICMTCHAGGAPIFPVRPWEETNAQPLISEKILETRAAKAADSYVGAPLVTTLSTPEAIDELQDLGNTVPATQQVWLDGCGDGPAGVDCRRLMLKLALQYLWNPAGFSAASDDYHRFAQLQQAAWPKNGIVLANGDLPNRNPFTDRPRASLWQWFRGLLPQERSVSPDVKLESFEKLPPLRRELDPLTPRTPKEKLQPGSLTAIAGLAQMFSPADKTMLERASDYEIGRLLSATDGATLDAELQAVPFRRAALVPRLLARLDKAAVGAPFVSTEGMSQPIVEGTKPLAVSSAELKPFEQYCFGCHRGNPSAKLDFMNGDTEAEVLAKIKETSAIRDALDYERYLGTDKENKLMPPRNSWQRAALDEARAQGKDDIARMQATVPSLFNF